MERAIFKGIFYIARGQGDPLAEGKAQLISYDSEGNQLSRHKDSVSMYVGCAAMFEKKDAPALNYKLETSLNPIEIKEKTIKFVRLVISGYGLFNGPQINDAYIRAIIAISRELLEI